MLHYQMLDFFEKIQIICVRGFDRLGVQRVRDQVRLRQLLQY